MRSKKRFLLFLSLLIALTLAISLYFYFAKETTTKVFFKTDDIITASMPDGTQAIVLLDSYNQQLASHPLLASIPLLNTVNSFMPEKLPIEIICFLQYSNGELNSLYTIGNDANCRGVFNRLISSDLLIDSPTSINVEDVRYHLYALRTGEIISAYIGEDYFLFSSNLPLLQIAVKRLYSNSTCFKSYDEECFNPTKTGNLRCFIRPNIIPFGRDGRASLEEWSSAEWLMMDVNIYPDSLSFQFEIDNPNRLKSDIAPCSESFNNYRDSTETLINYLSYNALFGPDMVDFEEVTEKTSDSMYELYWNQCFLDIIKRYCLNGVLIKTLADDVTIGENILILPFDAESDFKDTFYRLLKDNIDRNQAILRKETIEGYWGAKAIPMPIFMKNMLNAKGDSRVVYFIFTDGELLCATNYTLLINYYKRSRQAVADNCDVAGVYSLLKGHFTAINNSQLIDYLTLPTLFFSSSIQNYYAIVCNKIVQDNARIRFIYSLSNQ